MNEIIGLIFLIAALVTMAWLWSSNDVRQTPGVFLELSINHIKIKGAFTMVQMTSTQQVSGQLTPQNRLGAPAPVQEGSVLIQSSNTAVCAVVTDPEDQTKFTLKATGPGVAQIDFAADADLGEGVVGISGFLGVEVVPAQAAGFGVAMGTPEEQPAEE